VILWRNNADSFILFKADNQKNGANDFYIRNVSEGFTQIIGVADDAIIGLSVKAFFAKYFNRKLTAEELSSEQTVALALYEKGIPCRLSSWKPDSDSILVCIHYSPDKMDEKEEPANLIADINFRINWVSPEIIQNWGLDFDKELIGRSLLEFIHPSDQNRVKQALENLQKGIHTGAAVYEISFHQGRSFFARARARIRNNPETDEAELLVSLVRVRQKEETEALLRRHLDYMQCATESISILAGLEHIHLRLNSVLYKLRRTVNASRAYIFENFEDSEAGLLMSQRFECCGPETESQKENPLLQRLPYRETGTILLSSLLARRPFAHIVAELENPDREILSSQGILSILILPIYSEDQLWGFIGFDDCEMPRRWYDEDVQILQTVADAAGAAISRHQKDEAIRESEARFRSLLQDIPSVAVQGYQLDGTVIYWNKASEKIYGYGAEEALGQKLFDLIIPQESVDFVRADIARMTETKAPTPAGELLLKRKDNSRIWVYSSHTLVQTPGRKPELYCLDIDISARKAAEKALQTERMLFSQGPVITLIWKTEQGWPIHYISQNIKDILGYSADELMAEKSKWETLIHPDDLSRLKEELRQFRQENRTYYNQTYRLRASDGAYRWFYDFTRLELNPDGTPAFIRGYIIDQSDLKAAEEARRESEEKFRMIAENTSDGILLIGSDQKPIYVSPAYAKQLGYSLAEELKHTADSIYQLIHPEDRDTVFQKIFKALSEKQEYLTYQYRVRHKAGHYIHREDTSRFIYDSAGKMERVYVVSRDISERKRVEMEKANLENQLVQAQKLESIGSLAGGVAHDFNNMLSIIMGNAELALSNPNMDSETTSHIQEILSAAERSSRLTRQLLAFARKQSICPRPLNFNEAVEEMLKMLKRLIGESIDLSWRPCDQPAIINMDPGQIDQILANLCINARDAIHGIGEIVIETENVALDEAFCQLHPGAKQGQYLRLSIRDNGSGMNQETLERIFEPFFTTKGEGQGTGLGLATVYGIVRQNQGFIYAESEIGIGTVFHIFLPVYSNAEEISSETEQKGEQIFSSNETILLVEDEPAILTLEKMTLEELGYKVITAEEPSKALQIGIELGSEIDLLITDIVMPKMNGVLLSQKLMKEIPGLKCIYVTGYTDMEIVKLGAMDSAIPIIEKPFSLRSIGKIIQSVLKKG
jgi:PAS domain S-box-containing protein